LTAGTLVKGTIATPSGPLYVRSSCKSHVFWVGPAVPSGRAHGSGWVQPATCLVCEDTTQPMDIEWWQEVASQADVAHAAQVAHDEMMRLRRVYENLTARLSTGNVQAFAEFDFDS
jgi:hypothetical protein